MTYTQHDLERDGFRISAAPVDDWRDFDPLNPVPNYFDFDWFSARHPDLYHRFALSSDGLMRELETLLDLSGLAVIDVGAGTGRSALAAAQKAKSVAALDAYESVVSFGRERARQAGLANLAYLRADRSALPFGAQNFDALINCWADLDLAEAYRVLKPGGYLIRLGAPLAALCGELTATLAGVFPHLIQAVAPPAWFQPGCPAQTTHFDDAVWEGLPVIPPTLRHDFTYRSDYGSWQEAAAIFGRLYGPPARQYFTERQQPHCTWRLRIEIYRVR